MRKIFFVALMLFGPFVEAQAYQRAYQVYVPVSVTKPKALVVMIHGCKQSSDMIAAGTKWNELAQKNNFIVLYPDQLKTLNPINCWNWFLPENLSPDKGEAKALKDLIQGVKEQYLNSNSPVYLAGMSSGAGIAATLLSCFPEDFKAAGLHSGPSYAVAKAPREADEVLRNGPSGKRYRHPLCDLKKYTNRLMVIQGMSDERVNPLNAQAIVQDYLSEKGATQEVKKELSGLKKITQTDYFIQSHSQVSLRLWQVISLGHAWSGGTEGLPYNDPQASSATEAMWSFFSSSL